MCWSPMRAGMVFLPTPSARRATSHGGAVCFSCRQFLPTPSARRATEIAS